MSTSDYTRNAHRRTIWAALQRYLMDKYVDGDTPARDTLVCEEVFFADKEVSQESLMEVIEDLQRREADERIQMTQYEFRRRHVDKSAATPSAKESPEERKPGLKRKHPPEPTRGPSHPKGGG